MNFQMNAKQEKVNFVDEEINGRGIERIIDLKGRLIAIILPRYYCPDSTEFFTPDLLSQQVGYIVYQKGGVIRRHQHQPIERRIVGTPEVLLVRSGQLEVELFSQDREIIGNRILEKGDVLILVNGGHGFKMLKDTVLLEIKQGPYMGEEDKVHF